MRRERERENLEDEKETYYSVYIDEQMRWNSESYRDLDRWERCEIIRDRFKKFGRYVGILSRFISRAIFARSTRMRAEKYFKFQRIHDRIPSGKCNRKTLRTGNGQSRWMQDPLHKVFPKSPINGPIERITRKRIGNAFMELYGPIADKLILSVLPPSTSAYRKG